MFDQVLRQILTRVSQFVNLPLHVLDHNAIQKEMERIPLAAAALEKDAYVLDPRGIWFSPNTVNKFEFLLTFKPLQQ